jgi:hypothetical protein
MLVGGAAVALASLTTAATAQAAVDVDDPFGDDGSWGYVNQDPTDDHAYINWQSKRTGACGYTDLGAGGFSDDFRIGGLGGNDTLVVLAPGNSFTFCGWQMVAPKTNNHWFSLDGGDGDDSLWVPAAFPFGMLNGRAGNDVIMSGRADGYISGELDNDSILTGTAGPNEGVFSSHDGNDCVQTPLIPPAGVGSISCGSGTQDRWWGPGGAGALPFGCEIFSSACCPGVIC